MPSLAAEKTLDIPGTVQHADNLDRTRDGTIEDDVAAERKTLNPRSQLLSAASRTRLVGQQLNRFVEFVDESVCIRHAVISYVAPNLDEIRACARANAEL